MNETSLGRGIVSETAGPLANEEPWPIFANREIRRKCARKGHDRIKTINEITACVNCGTEVE